MDGSMHHEVLLALAGYPGSIFRISKETSAIEVDPTLPFIHPSEVSLLNRICQLGTHHSRLRKFIADQNAFIFSLPPVLPPTSCSGLYLKALACGMDQVLNSYRQALVNLEQKCMSEPHLPLSHIQSQLEEFQLLLPSLEACVQHVMSERCRGCQVLSYLYDQCASGIPVIQNSFERILCVCHGVLYKQLSAWMLHGLLLDNKDEFFIQLRQRKEKDKNEEKSHEVMGLEKSQETPETRQFCIEAALAPSYLPLRILEKILFVGEAVTIFQTRVPAKDKVGIHCSSPTGAGSKLRTDQFRFGHMLTELQRKAVFKLHDFEKVVDCIRDCVAELLWKLLVEDSNLTGHLQVMKDLFLLGRGELFLTFIDLSHNFMCLPPTATTPRDVNVAFHQAMIKVGIDSDKMTKLFQLTLPNVKQKGSRTEAAASSKGEVLAGKSAWDQLSLTHTTEWPLHILFTPAILNKYNILFQVLLGVRRTQVNLQHSWALLMQHRRRLEELRHVWQLRTHMGFLIDNLQYYVQVDVLEAQFSQLLEKMNNTHDFETIKHAHEQYLTTLHSQLFLTQPSISRCLSKMMELCNTFSSLLENSRDLCLGPAEQAEVNRISRDFSRHSSLFFDVVSGVKVHSSAPHLAQLLLRVDYNKYFSTSKLASPLQC